MMLGKTILHYKILAKLGEGGMGVVYKAEDTKLERVVAIKFLPHHIVASAEERERFKIEAKAAAALNHPNITTIYAIEEVDGEMFIVMEFIDSEELRKKVGSDQLSVNSVMDIATQIAEGLKAAHAKGITHRDIKSSNIMVTESGQVKIMDFGLAKMRGDVHLTKTGMTLGTAAYMSPEQARGEPVDYRTDIWSLGVVLYEMLTGKLAFRGEYEAAMMYSILNEEPEPISSVRNDVPPALETIVQKALAKNPESRFITTEELIVALRAIDKSSESSGSELRMTSSKRRVSFTKLRYVIAGFLLLALIVVAGMFLLKDQTGAIETLAILPFSNEGPTEELRYISDGIPETIILRLSQLPGLKIRSLSSVSRYRQALPDLQKVASDLDVEAVLIGKVSRRNENLAIVVELVNAGDNTTIWGHTYSRKLTDLLAIQEEITNDILTNLRAELSGEERQKLEKSYTKNSEAYQAYLKGRYFEQRWSEADFRKALEYYRVAVDLDPGYALAYSGIADAHLLLGVYGFIDYREAMQDAKMAAERAIQIDDELAEAHTSLGNVLGNYDWDFRWAENEFRRAIALNPNYAEAHHFYGYVLSGLGRHDEAIREARAALELEPLSPVMNQGLGTMYFMARKYQDAVRFYQTCLELNPRSMIVLWHPIEVYFHLSRSDESIKMAEKYLRAADNEALADSLQQTYEYAGYNAALRQLTKSNDDLLAYAYPRAIIFALLGDNEACLRMLEKAVKEHTAWVWLNVQPAFDTVRSDPRFTAIVNEMFGAEIEHRMP